MIIRNINSENIKISSIILFFFGLFGLGVMLAFDKFYWPSYILEERWPDFSLSFLIRGAIILVSTLALVLAFIGGARSKIRLFRSERFFLSELSILLTFLFAVIVLYLFIFQSELFSVLSLEDKLVEWASTLFLFAGSFVFIITIFRYWKSTDLTRFTKFSLIFLAFGFFVLAMEEISWFQRVLEIETPKAFEKNLQHEMNLHNFASNLVENVFYLGIWLFLIVLPFLYLLFSFISKNRYFQIFIARPFVVLIGAIAFAYNFDMWNILFTQITFYATLIILIAFYYFSSYKKEKFYILAILILMMVSQFLFLLKGDNFERLWEVTEYKEFFIALALFIYSLDVLVHLQRLPLNQAKVNK